MLRLAKERRHRLGETLKLHEVKREVDELHSWISDKVGTYRDATQSIAALQDSTLGCRLPQDSMLRCKILLDNLLTTYCTYPYVNLDTVLKVRIG